MVAGHLFDEGATACVLEDHEVPDEVKQAARVEDAFKHDLQLREMGVGQALARDCTPGFEPLAAGGEGADARLHAVGDHQHGVEGEQRRQLRLVGLELLVGRPDGGVLVSGVLELDQRQWQAVDEQHHVRASGVPVLTDGELVHRQPVVVGWVVEVQHACLRPADGAFYRAVLDCHPVNEQAVDSAVARLQRRPLGASELAIRISEGFGRQRGVEPRQGVPQTLREYDLAEVIPLSCQLTRRDFRAVFDRPV